jgi:Flp pilus assembly protein TadB
LWIILGTTIAVAVAVVLLPFLFPSCNVIFIALLSFAGLLALFRDPVSDLMYQRFGR